MKLSLRKRAAARLRHPLETYTRFASVRFQRIIITSPDYPRCYSASLRSASVPFLSGGSAACSTKGGVGERTGTEWVFDKSFLDFSYYTYIFILLRWIFRRRFSRQRIIRRWENQQRRKDGKAHQSCLAICRFYRAEADVIVLTSKVVNK